METNEFVPPNMEDIPNVEVKTSPLPGVPQSAGFDENGFPIPPTFRPIEPARVGSILDEHTQVGVRKYRKDKKLLQEDLAATNTNDSQGTAAIDALSPQAEQSNKQEWENLLDKYMKNEPQFLYRLENSILTSEDVSIVCETLEGSGEEGLSLDVFAARVRLLERDLVDLALRYPRIEKAIKLSRVKRKGFFLQTMVMTAHKSTATMRELFENDAVNVDLLQKMEKEKDSTKLEDEITNDLRKLGVKPGDYTSITYLTGDLPNVDELPNPTEGMGLAEGKFLTAPEIKNLLAPPKSGTICTIDLLPPHLE